MNYNWKEVGKRIRSERKRLSYTQSDLIELINRSDSTRQLIGKWENGKAIPTLNDLINLCKLFDCELGYLLCEKEYSCKTREITDIQKATGLSEKAIKTLLKLKIENKLIKDNKVPPCSQLSRILEQQEAMVELLNAIEKYVWSFNEKNFNINKEPLEVRNSLSKTFNCKPSELDEHIKMSSQALIESAIMKIVENI